MQQCKAQTETLPSSWGQTDAMVTLSPGIYQKHRSASVCSHLSDHKPLLRGQTEPQPRPPVGTNPSRRELLFVLSQTSPALSSIF